MKRQDFGELLAEALAVFIIIAFGDSVAAMYTLYNPSPYLNSYWGVCIAWGLAVTMAIYATGSISGTHANPAVTLALALYRKFSWRKVIPYCVAQVIGGLLGAALVYILYVPVIDHFDNTAQLTRAAGGAAGVFFTHPGLAITPMHAFGDEIILTAFLIFGIFAITEQHNEMAPQAHRWAISRHGHSTPRAILARGSFAFSPAGGLRPSPHPGITGGSRLPVLYSADVWAAQPTSI
jgi:glycerol uptake facilitator protein